MFLHSTLEAAGTNPDSCTVSLDLPGLFKHPLSETGFPCRMATHQSIRRYEFRKRPESVDVDEIVRELAEIRIGTETALAA